MNNMILHQIAVFSFSLIVASLFLCCPGYIIWRKQAPSLKRNLLICVSSLALNQYLLMLIATIKDGTVFTFGILALATVWASLLFFRLGHTSTPLTLEKNKKRFVAPLILTALVMIFSTLPRIDLLIDRSPNANASIVMSSIHDDIKHIAILKAMSLDGLDIANPFFAKEPLKYYLGYYILPAAFINSFDLSPTVVWYFWTLVTNILWVLSLFVLIGLITRSQLTTFIIVVSTFLMGSWDILPSLYYNTTSYIEAWNSNIGSSIQIPTTYAYLIYLPQHIFATNIFLFLSYIFLNKKTSLSLLSYIAAGLALSIITVNSAYIGILSVILSVVMLFVNKAPTLTKVRNIAVMLTSAAITIIPLLGSLVGNSAGFKLGFPSVTALSSNPIITTFLALTFKLVIDLGWLFPIGVISLIYFLKHRPTKKLNFLQFQAIAFVTTLILVHFISTKFYNDWGMKGSIFLYTSLTFLSAYYIGKSWQRLIIFSPAIVIGIATFSLTTFQLYQPYLSMETSAIQALQYADTNTPASSTIVGNDTFYNSLIPTITNHPTIVSPLSAEANTVADQSLFNSINTDLKTIFTTESATEFNETLNKLKAPYVFLVQTNNKNYSKFTASSLAQEIYNNNRYALFSLKQT